MSAADDCGGAEYGSSIPTTPTTARLCPLAASNGRTPGHPRAVGRGEALKVAERTRDGFAAADTFIGVILIESHGKVLSQEYVGFVDRETEIPLKLTDKFRLGSMNKMFTGHGDVAGSWGKAALGSTARWAIPGILCLSEYWRVDPAGSSLTREAAV